MTNLLPTITPKSDQLNADDLIGRSLTIKVTRVALCGEADQPIAVHYEGDDGKPYKPCKSMRRVMVHVWGPDGSKFAGRRMTLYRDDSVRFGNAPVGGIRISHMSGIKGDVTMALTATRANRKPFTVSPLPDDTADPVESVDLLTVLTEGRAAAARGSAALTAWWSRLSRDEKAAAKPTLDSEFKAAAGKADEAAFDDPAPSEAGDDFPGDAPDAGEGEGAGSDDAAPDPMIVRADRTVADLEFKSLAELKTLKEDGRFKAFLSTLRVQHPAKADEVEKALEKALEAFG